MGQRWYKSLRAQVVLLLTLALLPLGAVAVYQTARVEAQAERNGELALLALTGRAAKEEELIIQRAIGVARLFASLAEDYIANPRGCTEDLQNFLGDNPMYSFIGVLSPEGIVSCGSQEGVVDVSNDPTTQQILADQEGKIVINRQGPISRESIFAVSEPFELDGQFAGFVVVSIPHARLPKTPRDLVEQGLIDLVTLNDDGDLVTSRLGMDDAAAELPSLDLNDDLQKRFRTAFSSQNQAGEMRTYTLFPIENSGASVMGIWSVEQTGIAATVTRYLSPAVFPLLMWLASMLVAMLSIYVLVSRHIARLRRNIALFAATRRLPDDEEDYSMPNELQELSENFETMTQHIVRDEAEMENVVRAKNVLIKEVHHRVKNNLQLISSIMNMQIRRAQHDETRAALHRLQDRVLSLATIHRDLYETQNGGRVDGGALIKEIVEKAIEGADLGDRQFELHSEIGQLWLYPDQAVPLSLMAAEAMGNALKFVQADTHDKSWVSIELRQDEQKGILQIGNSKAASTPEDVGGLGAQLINAFAIQLGGNLNIENTEDAYTIRLSFAVEEFKQDLRDF